MISFDFVRTLWWCVHLALEFCLNYTKFATLAIKVHIGKSKINLAENVHY